MIFSIVVRPQIPDLTTKMTDQDRVSLVGSLHLNSGEHSELLRLLRGINQKLSQDHDRRSVLSTPQPDEPILAPSSLWRWYENAYNIGYFKLPPSGPESLELADEIPPIDLKQSLENDVESYNFLARY